MFEWIVLTLSISYLIFLVYERYALKKYRNSFQHVIHVAGTRGKSTVARMIGHALSKQGIRTFTKVTGTIPIYIDVDGNEHVIKRSGSANIREQIKMMRKAYQQHAEVVVIENMALKDEYLKITQHQMLKANIVIITNSRVDHKEENVNQKEFYDFSSIVPYEGDLYIETNDLKMYEQTALNRHSRVFLADPYELPIDANLHKENVSFALAIGKRLGFSNQSFYESLIDYPRDIGQFNLYKIEDTVWINAFSINDQTSLNHTYQSVLNHPWVKNRTLSVLINNRSDRPLRAMEHLRFIAEIQPKKVYVIGAFYHRFKSHLKHIEVHRYQDISDLKGQVIFAFGNIQNKGFELIAYFEKSGVIYDG